MAPKAARSASQMLTIAKAREALTEKDSDSEILLRKCQSDLADALADVDSLSHELQQSKETCTLLATQLAEAQQKISDLEANTAHEVSKLKAQVAKVKGLQELTYKKLRAELRACD